jgi:acylglycerol lipase
LTALQQVREQLDRIAVPLLVLHGTADKLTDPEGAQLLYERASSPDKTLRLYEGAYHELVNDLPDTRQAVLADILGWVNERVAFR